MPHGPLKNYHLSFSTTASLAKKTTSSVETHRAYLWGLSGVRSALPAARNLNGKSYEHGAVSQDHPSSLAPFISCTTHCIPLWHINPVMQSLQTIASLPQSILMYITLKALDPAGATYEKSQHNNLEFKSNSFKKKKNPNSDFPLSA